jgi:hypothetical protein
MWHTIRQIRNPKILVEHQEKTAFSLRNIPEIWQLVADTLESGYLQGRIKLNFCELHLNRQQFIWDEHGKLMKFGVAVGAYVRDIAAPLIANLHTNSVIERNAEILRKSVETFENFLEANPELMPAILQGLVTDNHKGTTEGDKKTAKPFRGKSLGDIAKLLKEKTPADPSGESKEKNILHSNEEDPLGRKKRIIKGQKGITVEQVEASPESGMDWRSRLNKGIIEINVSHEDWRFASSRKDRGKTGVHYTHLQIMKELTCLQISDALRAQEFRKSFERLLMPYWRATVI